MLTFVPIGLGLGPIVMLEVLLEPDKTALTVALEALAAFTGNTVEMPTAAIKDKKITELSTIKINLVLFIFVRLLHSYQDWQLNLTRRCHITNCIELVKRNVSESLFYLRLVKYI
jgi:hypothetical protein